MNMSVVVRYGFVQVLLLISFGVPCLHANKMQLDRSIIYFEPGQPPRQDIQVTNIGKTDLFLQSEVYKVLHPGTEKEEQVRVTNPDDIKLLTTPDKARIHPKAMINVRLVSLETPKEQEAVYRVTFRPVTGDSEVKQSGIQILVAYQVLVFVRPEKPTYKLVAKFNNGTLTVSNQGNSNVELRYGELCRKDEKQKDKKPHCEDYADGGRLYAGQSLVFDVPPFWDVLKFRVFDGQKEDVREFSLTLTDTR